MKDFQKGDFIKVFGQVRHSLGKDGTEYSDIKLLSTKLLKAKVQMKEQAETKKSTLEKLQHYKEKVAQEKSKPQDKSSDREM